VPEAARPYRLPGAVWLAPLAFIFCSEIIYWSGWDTVWKLSLAIVAGYLLIGTWMAFDKKRPPLDWKSAQWLPFYLIAMGIVSWQGRYCSNGPTHIAGASCSATNRIPFWADIGIVAGIALVTYIWAYFVSLSRDEHLGLVGRQEAEQEAARASS
jgi:amino acid transporter